MSGWLITGAKGMLGRDLVALLEREDEDVTRYGRSELDITDAAAVGATLRRSKPAVVVNCAAWTAVDEAETHEDAALQVNGHAVVPRGRVRRSRQHSGTGSTDYVEADALKRILAAKVDELGELEGTEPGPWLAAFERALDRAAALCGLIARLSIDERLVAMSGSRTGRTRSVPFSRRSCASCRVMRRARLDRARGEAGPVVG